MAMAIAIMDIVIRKINNFMLNRAVKLGLVCLSVSIK